MCGAGGVGWDGMRVVFGAWVEIRSCWLLSPTLLSTSKQECNLESVLTSISFVIRDRTARVYIYRHVQASHIVSSKDSQRKSVPSNSQPFSRDIRRPFLTPQHTTASTSRCSCHDHLLLHGLTKAGKKKMVMVTRGRRETNIFVITTR